MYGMFRNVRCFLAPLLIAVPLVVVSFSCKEMGLGPSIDLKAPKLELTGIELPDGSTKAIDADSKLLIGPGIKVANGFLLKGTAWDNVLVESVVVEDTSNNAKWSTKTSKNSRILSPPGVGQKQDWVIQLDNIEKGKRTITITAYDRHKNIGPDTVRQLTLLVDTDPPFVDSVKIERRPGIEVDLLPKSTLEQFDSYLFEYIDYFQNEQFTIRAAISHDFSLAPDGVTLNFFDEDGEEVFTEGLQPASGSLYAPVWFITAEDLIAARPAYAGEGPHYLNVAITAKAEAGHSGYYEDKVNWLYSLCWYPDADKPRMQIDMADADGSFHVETGGIIPLRVFDDDNVDECYAALLTVGEWNEFMAKTDEQKLAWFILLENHIKSPTRNTIIPTIRAGNTRGEYRLVVLARDKKDDDKEKVWGYRSFTVNVIEEGTPLITVSTPADNTSPTLTNGTFTLSGSVIDLYGVEQLKMIWIPDSLGWSAEKQNTDGETILMSGPVPNGVKLWNLTLAAGTDEIIGDKTFKKQAFNHTFNIFNDFVYNDGTGNKTENKPKFLMLYTQGRSAPAFLTLRLGDYTEPPDITIISPENFDDFSPNGNIGFVIKAESGLGVPIDSVKVTRKTGGGTAITAVKNAQEEWRATTNTPDIMGNYTYTVTAKDILGNEAEQDVTIEVAVLAELLESVICTNPPGAYPQGSTLNFKLIFSGRVYTSGSGNNGPSITIHGRSSGPNDANTGNAVTIRLNSVIPEGSADFAINFSWQVPSGILWIPLQITNISLTGIMRTGGHGLYQPGSSVVSSVIGTYNTEHTGLKVMSIAPTIDSSAPVTASTNATDARVLTPGGGKSTVTLNFSHPVWPEVGMITVKPTGSWRIPPVLGLEDFAKVSNALSTVDQAALTDSTRASYYIRNTHGLLKNSGGAYIGTPDTGTKYVLNFNSGLDDNNNLLRPIFERAKYMWQEFEVVSTAHVAGGGTKTITLQLDQLADGRQWKIEIAAGAFRDEAGNPFGTSWNSASNHTFWSAKTAEPVIRVNRISNNSATVNPTSNTVSGTPGTTNEVTSRINVQYRIDCETPGAAIDYGTWNKGTSYIDNTMTSSDQPTPATSSTGAGIYIVRTKDGPQNSAILDATNTELSTNTNFGSFALSYTLTGTNYHTIGDSTSGLNVVGGGSASNLGGLSQHLYSARKDYIGARATKAAVANSAPALGISNTGYEGAFKTLVIFRNHAAVNSTATNIFVKIEGADTYGGRSTIAGFPMQNNDMTGKSSKLLWRQVNTVPFANNVDWIWISWEIVSNFYHTGLTITNSTPNSSLTNGGSWNNFAADGVIYGFRKYGNWGLRIAGNYQDDR